MPVYQTKGTLTDIIEPENVEAAQKYLQQDHEGNPINMHQYLDPPLTELVELLEWQLDGNGHDYRVLAVAKEPLTDDELKQLSSEVSGQNSDGLGEGFEQQGFAWATEGECSECTGCENGWGCEDESGHMISFDWEKNELPWTRIA